MQKLQANDPQFRRVNILSLGVAAPGETTPFQEKNVMMRTTKAIADKLVAAGTHVYSTKGKLRSFLNKNMKLTKNSRVLNSMIPATDKTGKVIFIKDEDGKLIPKMIRKYDFEDKKSGHKVAVDEYSGKTYAYLFVRNSLEYMENTKEIDPFTGKPKRYTIEVPVYQNRIANYPV